MELRQTIEFKMCYQEMNEKDVDIRMAPVTQLLFDWRTSLNVFNKYGASEDQGFSCCCTPGVYTYTQMKERTYT